MLSESPGGTEADWWSEDELLVVIDNRRTLARLSANGGAPSPVLILDNSGPISLWGGVHVLPGGGTLLLYLLEDSSEGILFRTESLDPETNERRTILADGWLRPYRDAAIVYRKGTTFAVPFDRDRLEITGPEIPVWDNRRFRAGGDSLAYLPRRTEPDRLIHVDRSGGIETLAESPDERLVDLDRSRDGQQIALLTCDPTRVRRNLWRFDVARELMQPVPAADAWKGSLAWTAESDGLLFSMSTDGLYKVGRLGFRAGDAWEPYFPDWTESTGGAEWAADGSVMALVSRDQGSEKRTLWLVSAGEGAEARPFIELQSRLARPTISPDGRLIAFASNESGNAEIYAAAIGGDSTRPDLLQVSERGGNRAIWSLDGAELFFHDPAGYLMSARLNPGAAGPSFERPEVVLDLNALDLPAVYDLSPDGSGFVFAKRAAEERERGSRIFVELGWASEFDALVDRP